MVLFVVGGIKGSDPNGFSRPIGFWYTYDKLGKIIKTIEYDEKPFHFTLENVKKFIEKENLNVSSICKSPAVIINGELKTKALWLITAVDENLIFKTITLNAETGEKIYEETAKIQK